MVVMIMVVVISGFQIKMLSGLGLISIKTKGGYVKVVSLTHNWVVVVPLVPVVIKIKEKASSVVS